MGPRGVHYAGPNRAVSPHLAARPFLNSERGFSGEMARVPLLGSALIPRRRFLGNGFFFFGGGCFGGFFPGFCSFGPGFFGLPFWDTWGWDNDGVAPPESFGYPFSPSMSDDIEARLENQPQYYQAAPFGYEYQYPPEAMTAPSERDKNAEGQLLLLYLSDGSVYGLTEYWVADGKLHYVTTYGGENAIDMSLVDVQHTVDVNAKRGVKFVLGPRANGQPDGTNPPQTPNPQQP